MFACVVDIAFAAISYIDVELAGVTVIVSEPEAGLLYVKFNTYSELLVFVTLSILDTTAVPPVIPTEKSLGVKTPVPSELVNTSSENVTVNSVLSLLIDVLEMIGAVLSIVIELPFVISLSVCIFSPNVSIALASIVNVTVPS